jgi:hypothetical protein
MSRPHPKLLSSASKQKQADIHLANSERNFVFNEGCSIISILKVQWPPNIYFLSLRTNLLALPRYPFFGPELFSGRFSIENKLKMFISENEFFHQKIRVWLFSAYF